MNIRKRLTIQFIIIVALMFLIASLSIYYFSANYRKMDFLERMEKKSFNTAKLLIEVDEIDATLLSRIEKDNPVSLPNEKIIIYNHKNEILYSSDKDHVINVTTTLLDKIRLNDKVTDRQGSYEILGYLFKDKLDRFVVIIGAQDIFGWSKLYNLSAILLGVFGISLIITTVSGYIYSGRALKPIKKVITRVEEISIKNINLRVDEGNAKDEIALLAVTFNNMLARLEKSFKIQENFIGNASHEIRTPLAVVLGQLEVTLKKDRSVGEYKSVIQSSIEEISNLVQISNRLLLLAQASSEKPITDLKPLRIDEIIWQAKSELLKRNPKYKISLSLDSGIDDENKLIIWGNEQLIKVVIINLLDNSCKFSADHSVETRVISESDGCLVTVIDQGIGIPVSDQLHIFEPFYRAKNSQSIKGHGIGLSLVHLIVSLHHGKLSFTSEENSGTTFSILFPSKPWL
jgi:signal transduction histidine kinase